MKATPRTILAVDDSPDHLRVLRRILEPAGYRVISAGSAEEAWKALEARVPDAAVVDWNLPGESGVEFCGRVRRDSRFGRLILLLLTVHDRPQDQAEGLREGGVNAYLVKPADPEELLARLKRFLEMRERA